MTKTAKNSQSIGRTVALSIPTVGIFNLPAKVDTGADISSIWASKISETDNELKFCLLGPKADQYTGEIITTNEYSRVRIKNSFGNSEVRYSVTLSVEIEGHRIKAKFSLANRRLKSYPALIGRRLLNKRFIVDVSKSHHSASRN